MPAQLAFDAANVGHNWIGIEAGSDAFSQFDNSFNWGTKRDERAS